MQLWSLFFTFLMIGCVSFGGGYAMIPAIEREVIRHGWMNTQELTDIIAVAGMSPGPIATNSAVLVGHQTAGISGAVVSALGMALPSLTLILIVATFFYRAEKSRLVRSAFYGLRPVIAGLIVYAAIRFAVSNHMIGDLSYHALFSLGIFVFALFALFRLRWHPAVVIVFSGMAGVVIYS